MNQQTQNISTNTSGLAHEWVRLPASTPYQKIGLFGGSFNPPHLGHLRVAETARKKLQLDAVWWLVSPGNPLKSKSELIPLDQRISRCLEHRQTSHPKKLLLMNLKLILTCRHLLLKILLITTKIVHLSG